VADSIKTVFEEAMRLHGQLWDMSPALRRRMSTAKLRFHDDRE
jgi:hypothetical protein